MLPDRVSNPGPLTYESGALPIALRGPVYIMVKNLQLYELVRQLQSCIPVRDLRSHKMVKISYILL